MAPLLHLPLGMTQPPANLPPGASADAVARTLARHPRPLGGDTARSVGPAAVSLTGMVLNNRPDEPHHRAIGRKPDWLRARVPGGAGYERLKTIIDEHRLHTVCQEASCPNMGECWGRPGRVRAASPACARSRGGAARRACC